MRMTTMKLHQPSKKIPQHTLLTSTNSTKLVNMNLCKTIEFVTTSKNKNNIIFS